MITPLKLNEKVKLNEMIRATDFCESSFSIITLFKEKPKLFLTRWNWLEFYDFLGKKKAITYYNEYHWASIGHEEFFRSLIRTTRNNATFQAEEKEAATHFHYDFRYCFEKQSHDIQHPLFSRSLEHLSPLSLPSSSIYLPALSPFSLPPLPLFSLSLTFSSLSAPFLLSLILSL